ncbi:YybH family protein [Changpingibacter yushuensis]|uniref:YybH family protein n=1 Tax=Changpingibacter yushuensis TaxID=2758440 RepID=UPI0015F3B18D|nr:nuclear transport factor 2 family protein [Changpingibacter yushuensis]
MPTSSDLTPSRARLEQTVTNYQSALNARDPERIAALFAPDATRADPHGTPPVIGRSAIRAAWEEIFTNLGSIAFTAHAAHGAKDTIAFEFTSVTTTSNGVGSVFGDSAEPHHAEALAIVAQTEEATAALLAQHLGLDEKVAATLARVVSSILFLTMASSQHIDSTVEQILEDIRVQIAVTLPQ